MSNPTYRNPQTPRSHPRGTSYVRGQITTRNRNSIPSVLSLKTLLLTGLFFIIGLAILAGLLAVSAVGVHYYFQQSGEIVPGVSTLNTDLSGKTLTEAAIELQKNWNLEKKILISDGKQSVSVPPSTLGINLDPLGSAQKAYDVGHGIWIVSDLEQMIYAYQHGWEVEPVITFDIDVSRSGLESISSNFSQPAQNASVRLEGTELVEVPAKEGFTIDIDTASQILAVSPTFVLESGIFPIELVLVKPEVTDISKAMRVAQALIDSKVSIKAFDPVENEHHEWEISPQLIGSWIKIDDAGDGPQVTLEASTVQDYLKGLNVNLGSERYLDPSLTDQQLMEAVQTGGAIQILIKHKATTYGVRKGDTLLKIGWDMGLPFWKILEANPGIDPDNLLAGTMLTIPPKDSMLPLPVIPDKRIVISISKQRLWIYQDDKLISKHLISTGIDRSPTQPGVFQVQTHKRNAFASVWDLYMPNFLGVYEAWPGFMNGFHGLPLLANGTRLWEDILGRPASFGCIILDTETSEWLYSWAENGVVVEIQP